MYASIDIHVFVQSPQWSWNRHFQSNIKKKKWIKIQIRHSVYVHSITTDFLFLWGAKALTTHTYSTNTVHTNDTLTLDSSHRFKPRVQKSSLVRQVEQSFTSISVAGRLVSRTYVSWNNCKNVSVKEITVRSTTLCAL